MKLSNLFLYITLFTYSSSLPSMAASSSSQTSTLRKKCSICLSKKMVKNFATLSCTHSYCNGCLNGLIDTSLTDKSTTILRCPNRDCKEPIGEADIRSITKNNSEKLDAYADVSTNEWIDRHPHAKRCPTPDCSYAFINDRHKTNTIQCPSCTQSYCSGCLIAHEKNIPCEQAVCSQLDHNTKTWIQKNTKSCPTCATHIEKNKGCDHMTCKKCNYEFCWNCNAPFRNAQGHPIHPSYCELPGGQGMADQNDYEEPIFDQRVQRALDLRNDARENNHLIEDRIRDEVRNNMERNEHQFKGSLCCITGCILMCSLMLNNHSRVADPHLFIKNYQPRFEGISSGQAMAERYCPNFLGAAPEDQKMMDPILACNELTTLEHGLNQHRVSMLNRLSDMFPSPPNGYYDAVTQSANEHQYNLAQIALAKEKCGCIKESKKTK